jgi:transcriptional regulator with GAF, ATPase, and Fis domain
MTKTDLGTPAQPADGLAAVVALRRLADQLEDAEVERALRAGWSWAQVAEALGVTRQAVHKKHARRLGAGGGADRGSDGS